MQYRGTRLVIAAILGIPTLTVLVAIGTLLFVHRDLPNAFDIIFIILTIILMLRFEWGLVCDSAKTLPGLLERCSDQAAVPHVIAGLGCKSRKYHPALRAWAIRVLPELGPVVREAVSSRDVHLLARQLDWRDPNLTSVVLEALVHAGDRDSVRTLEAFLGRNPNDAIAENTRAPVDRCLALLKSRLASEAAMNTLLRGSESPQGSDVLLRQSAEHTDHKEELLRASE